MKGAFNATVTQSFKPFVDAINKAQSASSPGGPLLTAEEKKIVGPMLVALKREITLKAQDVFTEALGDPRYRKYISMADFDTFMKIPNQTLNTLDMMVNSENVDGLKALMNDFSYTREKTRLGSCMDLSYREVLEYFA